MNLAAIQEELQKQKLDGWLFFDHHRRDPLAYRVLGFQPASHVTRRWYYWIPATGEPRGLVHRIESGRLDSLPGDKIRYSSWSEQTGGLRALVGGARRVAMQYSPMCAIPYVAMVDAGTVELVRSLGVEVVTSAELIQHFEARWSAEALESHLEAGRRVDRVRAQAFEMIREITRGGGAVEEFAVAQFVRDGFAKAGLCAEDGPIVGVNANAANPHYEPSAEITSEIRSGDLVLLDMWAKLDRPGAAGDLPDHLELRWQVVGRFGPPSLVVRHHRVAERLAGQVEGDGQRGRLVILHDVGHHGHEPVHGIGDHAGGRGQCVRQREVGAKGQRHAVEEKQWT